MKLEITQPNTEMVLEVLEAVLAGKISRSEVKEWKRELDETFDYYGPGVSFVPLKVGEGYYVWYTFEYFLDQKIDLWMSPEKQYLVRDQDIQYMIDDLKQLPCNIKVGDFTQLYSSQIPREEFQENYGKHPEPILTLKVTEGNPLYKLGLSPVRMVQDNLHDLREFCCFKYKSALMGFELEVERPSCIRFYANFSNWELAVEVLLLSGITVEMIDWVNPKLEKAQYMIRRMDDNGIEFDLEKINNPLLASLKVEELNGGIHKQTYWMEELSD